MAASPESILEALPVAVYTTDAEGRITFYNQAAADLWGVRPSPESLWCGSWRLFHINGEPLRHEQCPMAVAVREGRSVRGIDAVLERPDGTRVPFRPFPTPLRDDTGRVIGAINTLIDLTNSQRAETDAARLAAIVSSSDDAIVSKRLDGTIVSWNAGAERIFGYTADEMIGKSILTIIPPERQDEEKHIIVKLTRGERIEHFETVRVGKQGRRIDLSVTVSPVRDSSGRIVGASKVARDIGERRRAEETQRLLINELNHRIMNTLATVQAIAGQSLRRSPSPEAFVTSFNGRIQALANAHSLLTAGVFQGAELQRLVHDQLLLGPADAARISCSGPSLILEPETALPLALLLHELGANARMHGALSMPSGTVSVTWELRSNGARTLLLNWKERGGPDVIAPAARGFGTTLIEQSLRPHGGSAEIRYAKDGVTCLVSLPLPEMKLPVEPHRPHTPALVSVSVAASGIEGVRVLVVEDEALIGMVLDEHLAEAGCVVVGLAQTVQAASAMIESCNFDVALLDGNLGGRPVDALAAQLTQKGVPFAFVTGYGREGLPVAFRTAPIVGKPFTQEQIVAAVSQLVTRDESIAPLRPRQGE